MHTAKKYCLNCKKDHELHLNESTGSHKNKEKFIFNAASMIPIVLGILVIISMLQAIELRDLRGALDANPAVAAVVKQQTATPDATSPVQGLPAQVGGC